MISSGDLAEYLADFPSIGSGIQPSEPQVCKRTSQSRLVKRRPIQKSRGDTNVHIQRTSKHTVYKEQCVILQEYKNHEIFGTFSWFFICSTVTLCS